MSLTLISKPEYSYQKDKYSRWNAIHQQEGVKIEYQRKDMNVSAWQDDAGQLKITIPSAAGLTVGDFIYLCDDDGIYTPGFYEIDAIDGALLTLILPWNGEPSGGFANSNIRFPNYNVLAEIYTIQEDVIGKNLLTNSDFSSWDADDPKYWNVTGEVTTDPEVSQVGSDEGHLGVGTGACNIFTTGSSVYISQGILTIGKTYVIEIEVTKKISGSISFKLGSTATYTTISTEGIHRYIKTAIGNITLYITALAACDITIDNVSVRELGSVKELIFTPDTTGLVKVDSVSALKMISSFVEESYYNTVNIRDANASGRFKVRVKEQWTGSSESWSEYSDTFYHTNSARQIKDIFGKNMYEYLLRDIQEQVAAYDTDTYDMHGTLVITGANQLTYFYREGTEHGSDAYAVIKARIFNILTKTWSEPWLVYEFADSAHYSVHNICGGLSEDGTKIILCFSKDIRDYNVGTTDPITGEADAGGGQVTILTADTTNLANGEVVTNVGTNNYNGTFIIANVILNTSFEITHSWDGNDGANGDWYKSGVTESLGYIISTDLTGRNWSARTVIVDNRTAPVYPLLAFEGAICKLDNGDLILGWYELEDWTPYYAQYLMKSTDGGNTWTAGGIWVTVYSGASYRIEGEFVNIGDGKIISLCRVNNEDPYMAISSDHAATWDAYQDTNLNTTGTAVIDIIYDPLTGKLLVFILDRGGVSPFKIYLSFTDALTVFANKQAFSAMVEIDEIVGSYFNGYCIWGQVNPGEFIGIYSKQVSASDADVWYFIVTSDDMQFKTEYLAKFLTKFIEPTRFAGYPWDISIIYPELLLDETLILKETPLNINESAGTPVDTTLDDGEIGYINRILPQRALESSDAYTIMEILRDETVDVLTSESKTIINEQGCFDNPLYLRWANILGGRDYWLFTHHQEYVLEIDNINVIERNISDIETAEAVQDIISKEAKEPIIIGVDNLLITNIDGIKGLLISPLVQMLINPDAWGGEGPKWKTIIVKKNTWNLYRNDRGTFNLELEIGLPELNIQTR